MTPNLALYDLFQPFVIILNEILLFKTHAEIDFFFLFPQLLVMESDLRYVGLCTVLDIILSG